MINLISDIVIKFIFGMLEVMMWVEVGDDVFQEDFIVNVLEEKVVEMFGKEVVLYCFFGMMINQIVIKVYMQLLDEVICDEYFYIY